MSNKLTLKTSVLIQASVSEVWDALTNPVPVKAYFFGTNLLTDWTVGDPIRFTGVWDGGAYEDKGMVPAFVPERYLSYNYWSSFSGMEDVPEHYVAIAYIVESVEQGTQLTVTQNKRKDEEAWAHSEKSRQILLAEMKKLLGK
ncbi:SRPBCC family protein [Runella slithyformis]|uniref:Activator of Hsp90 ATPase 1 family protein n=1 Tax=Runella slithyformis (strain ATCC 29530 / DSM 19594 / LMG 11500 / NCIMB 11436 / LSU 4) TaxID=761193 RepID=A0A7U4E525_RUNSL|nr:SRPBCC domain-containing protein [Runella slithyformis]AEI47758.1 Activator of Hsp90 ATPase 1 family protein [Runella slithyformis DSM 19594]